MRAAIFVEQDGDLVVEDVKAADPGPRDVVVRITASGVCHSDLSVINGTLPMPPPAILGHEGTGIVEDVGAELLLEAGGDAGDLGGGVDLKVDVDAGAEEGVTIRPLRQITGDAEFNEVFFENARVPDAWRLGPVGER